jgi:hypothetical protein
VIDMQRLILDMLSTQVSDVGALLPDASGWGDAISLQDPKLDTSFLHYPTEEALDGYILSRLGHIVVNPGDAELVDALISSYVTLQDTGYGDLVNCSPETVDGFVRQLMDLAEEESRVRHNRNEGGLVIVYGPRGCGKTFF